MWQKHFYTCFVLVLILIPVFLLDHVLLGGSSSGGWIALRLDGLFVIAYSTWLIFHVCVSTIAVYFLPHSRLLPLHIGSGIASVVFIVIGISLYMKIPDQANDELHEMAKARRALHKNAIELKEWWCVPDLQKPKKIFVCVHVRETGRFAGNADVKGIDSSGLEVPSLANSYNDEREDQRWVKAGDDFMYSFTMDSIEPGAVVNDLRITLYLFKDSARSNEDAEEVKKIYTLKKVASEYEDYFYELLP